MGRLATLLNSVVVEASWVTPSQKPKVSYDIFIPTQTLNLQFSLLLAFIRTGGGPDEKYDLPESYLKVFLKDSPIPEPSIFFSPPVALMSPNKTKVDHNTFYPTTSIEDPCHPGCSSPCVGVCELHVRGMS